MERTSRGKFEGGDADWEEKKLKSYSNSEVRLVEIQEKLCTELSKGSDQVRAQFSPPQFQIITIKFFYI